MQITFATIFALLFNGLINFLSAQQTFFKNYTVNDGLVSSSVRKIFQDSKGFIWIGTLEGLSKYDGNKFINFTAANGLSYNTVNDFYETKDGKIYVALNNGSVDFIKDDKASKGLQLNIVINRFIHAPWNQVIATTDGNGFFIFENGMLNKAHQDSPQNTFHDIVFLNDTTFLAAGINYIEIFNRNYTLIRKIKVAKSEFSAIKIFRDSKNRIWIASNPGLVIIHWNPEKNKIAYPVRLSNEYKFPDRKETVVNDIFEDSNGAIWVATSTGIVKINADNTRQTFTVEDGLISNNVTSIFQDKEKNIWFGTVLGLSKLVTSSGIVFYPVKNGIHSDDNQYLMYPLNQHNLLVSTSNNVSVFNKTHGTFTPVSTAATEGYYGIIVNTSPMLFISSGGLATFDTLNLRFKKVKQIENYFPGKMIRDGEGNFFVGNLSGLFFNSASEQTEIMKERISALLIDKPGFLWAATWKSGLYRIRYISGKNGFQLLAIDLFLPGANIRTLFKDSKGNIWAGCRNEGIFRLSKNGKDSLSILHLTQKNGLTSNYIRGIREDKNGHFWIAFYHGLDKLIPRSDSFQIFNFSKINNYFAGVTGIETDTASGILWVATTEGIVRIKDGELENTLPLQAYITKVSTPDSIYSLSYNNLQLN